MEDILLSDINFIGVHLYLCDIDIIINGQFLDVYVYQMIDRSNAKAA